MRPVFDPTGGPDVLVEKMIGTAYETVKRVYCHLPEIRRLDGVLTEIPVLAQTSVDNALAVALPPILAQMDEKVQAAEGWAGEAEASAEAAAQSALAATKVNMMFPFTSDVSQMIYDVTVISGQTDVNTVGMALWVEGAIEFDFTILSATTFMLNDATAYPDNAQMRVILNAHFNDLVHGFDQLLGALEQEYKDAAALNGRWCGLHLIPPTTRLDNSPLQEADEYQNRSDKLRYSWNGFTWVALNSSAQQLEAALAAPSGATKLGFRRSKLGEDIGTLSSFLSAQPRNIYEFLEYVTDRPGVSPDTWDWTRATIEAAKLGGIIEFPDGVYTYRPTTQYFADGATRICAVRFGSDTLVRFSPNTKIVSRDNDTAFDYREIFLAMGVSNTVFSGGGLFDGGLLPDASNVAALPKVGITIRASSWCEIVDLRAQDFAYHGFAAYASEVGGCSDVTFRRLVSKRGRASSIIMYSSVANAGHAPNRRMRVIDCEGSESGQFFGIELRGCIDSEIVAGSYHNNKVGGVNIEENSHRVRVHSGTEIYGNVQGGIVSGSQGACNDVTWEDVYIHNNSGSQLSNFAGNRMKVIRSRILDGGSVGVNVLVTAGGVVADGVELIDTVVTGHASTGFVSRGANAKISGGSVITGNGGADVQVSNDGLVHQNSSIGVFAYDTPSRQVAGTSLTASSTGATLKILGRLGVDEERSRLVGASEAGTDFGSLEFVRQGAGSGRVEVYGYLSNTRKLLATFTRDGDVQLATSSRGLITQAPNGTRWRIRVNNSGAIVTESVA